MLLYLLPYAMCRVPSHNIPLVYPYGPFHSKLYLVLHRHVRTQQSQPRTKSLSSVAFSELESESAEPSILGPQIPLPNSSLRSKSTTFREAIVSVSMVDMNLYK
jgi:hypothetical protein